MNPNNAKELRQESRKQNARANEAEKQGNAPRREKLENRAARFEKQSNRASKKYGDRAEEWGV